MCTNFKIVNSRFVPCGKCEECLNLKRKAEYNRLKMAYSDSCSCYHLTLTYSDKYINSVSFDNVRRFLEKLRKTYPSCLFEYYCVHENGEKKGREHFHLLLFSKKSSLPLFCSSEISRLWKYGFIKFKVVQSPSRFFYLTNYLFKQYNDDKKNKVSVKRNFSCTPRLGFDGFIKEYNINKGQYYYGNWSKYPRCFKKLYFKYIIDNFALNSKNVISSFYSKVSDKIYANIMSPEIINFCFDNRLVYSVCCNYDGDEKYFNRAYNEYFSIINRYKDSYEFKFFVFVSKYIIPYVPSEILGAFVEALDDFLIKVYYSIKQFEIVSTKVSDLGNLVLNVRDDGYFDSVLRLLFPADKFEYFIGCFKYLYF